MNIALNDLGNENVFEGTIGIGRQSEPTRTPYRLSMRKR